MSDPTARRHFLGRLAALGASIGLLPVTPLSATSRPAIVEDPWMQRVTGAHRVVFHSHMPTDGLALRWAQTFLDTQRTAYGVRESDCTVIVGLNGRSIGWFFNDTLWAKYPTVGEVMGTASTTSPYRDAIAALTARKVILLACNNSIRASGSRFLPVNQRSDRERVSAFGDEVRANLLAGVDVVPAMIVTLQQAQDRGCRYVYAGG